ncbi:glycosyltransferase family 2 protein [Clostridium tyrobutyricum]|uniref:glycosyltransferase family 2 protein n=1 Tax=Clostridium tyrobutyricum TaxID=1519 RepID=UPI001C385D6F|nr:glycosyltransferase family 2 protein [Clostridium tyrobutyricum]MBV4417559.1 glycosyltransferase [Clostridium tyrobutyricum]MBV4417560.1 glycosyltransferase [Clostridium tyrobutyricum]
MRNNYKISLVMATLGRKDEVNCFIKSLLSQNYSNYELILVDQNDKNFIKNIYNLYKNIINIKYIHSNKKGLSVSRNLGLKYVTGDIVAFPDDDCEYSPKLLEDVIKRFNENNVDIITFKSIDKLSKADSNNKWNKYSTDINMFNIFNTSISYTIFIKYKNIKDIIFDEQLGVGAYFGSAEESDMLLNLLYKEYNGKYFPDLFAFHPIKPEVKDRYYKYALGMGALFKKEISCRRNFKYLYFFLKYIFIKPLGGLVLNCLRLRTENVKKYSFVFLGRLIGFIKYS